MAPPTGRQADDGAQVGPLLDQLAEHECVSFTRYRLEEVRKRKLGYLLTDHVRMLVRRPGVDAAPDTGVAHLLRHLREAPPPPRHSHGGIGVIRTPADGVGRGFSGIGNADRLKRHESGDEPWRMWRII